MFRKKPLPGKENLDSRCEAASLFRKFEALERELVNSNKNISDNVIAIRKRTEKKDSVFFLWAQLLGTFIVLLSWFLQNNNINKTNAEILRLQGIRSDIKDLTMMSTLEKMQIDFFEREVHDNKDTDFTAHIELVEAYANYCHSLIRLKMSTMETMPLNINIGSEKFDSTLKQRWIKEAAEDEAMTERYHNTFVLDDIRYWEKGVLLSFNSAIYQFTKAGADYQEAEERTKSRLSSLFIGVYIFGSILIILGLCKSFKKVSFLGSVVR